jgi:hypothetical protein
MPSADRILVTQPAGLVTVPRGAVTLGTSLSDQMTLCTAWLDWEVENNALSSADTFSIRFAGSSLPPATDVNWFSGQKDMFVEIFAGFPEDYDYFTPQDLTKLIFGQVDTIDYDIASDTVTVHGRDLTRVFIDTKTTEKFQNQTSSQIATTLAKRRGLTPQVTATKTKAGAYYDIEHVNLMDERTEWDILSFLAQQEGFIVTVKDKTLYFGPPPAADSAPYPIVWTQVNPTQLDYRAMAGNVEDMQFQRTLTVSRGVTVIVRSWNDKNQYGFNATYPPKKVGSLQPGQATTAGGGQVFTFFYPNIDKQRALQIAQQKYDLIVAHEMKFSCRIPGDVTLNAQTVIQVSGTGTAFDQTYYPSQIVRRMSFDGGFEMTVHGKNHAATSQAVPL